MDRFKSFFIDKEGYLLNVSRYIHLNPLEANIVQKPENYKWNSYNVYFYALKNDIIDKNEFYELLLKELKKLQVSNFEIVFVNDGSTDGSVDIIQDLANKHSFVKSIQLSLIHISEPTRPY